MDPMDAQTACIALAHEATLATRNDKDFDVLGSGASIPGGDNIPCGPRSSHSKLSVVLLE